MWTIPIAKENNNLPKPMSFKGINKDGVQIKSLFTEESDESKALKSVQERYNALSELEVLQANIEETLFTNVPLEELQADYPNIEFKFPAEPELFPETPKFFTGKFFAVIGEDISGAKFKDADKDVIRPTVQFYAVPGSFVTLGTGQTVYAMQDEGLPFEVQEAAKANQYEQLKIYEEASSLVWEDSLRRDKENESYLQKLKAKLGAMFTAVAE